MRFVMRRAAALLQHGDSARHSDQKSARKSWLQHAWRQAKA
jgi:hypothetical protein